MADPDELMPGGLRVAGGPVIVDYQGRRQVLADGEPIPATAVLVGNLDGTPLEGKKRPRKRSR